MVERPIKKSERVAQAASEAPAQAAEMGEKSRPMKREGGRDADSRDGGRDGGGRDGGRDSGGRKGGRGRRDSGEEESKGPVNPVFARGPKPPKAQPPAPEVEEATEEAPVETEAEAVSAEA